MAGENLVIKAIFQLVDQVSGPLKGVTGAMSAFKRVAAFTVGGVTIGAALKEVFDASVEAQASLVKTTEVVRRFGAASGVTVDQINELSSTIQKTSRFSDETAAAALRTAVRFGATKDQLNDLAKLIPDVAEAFEMDLGGAATFVARAMQSPEFAMRRLRQEGIKLTDTQIATVKSLADTGRTAQAAAIVLDKLRDATQGAAKAGTQNLAGAWERLKNVFGDFLELTGPIDALTKSLNFLSDALAKFAEATAVPKSTPERVIQGLESRLKSARIREGNLAKNAQRGFPDAIADLPGAKADVAALEATIARLKQARKEAELQFYTPTSKRREDTIATPAFKGFVKELKSGDIWQEFERNSRALERWQQELKDAESVYDATADATAKIKKETREFFTQLEALYELDPGEAMRRKQGVVDNLEVTVTSAKRVRAELTELSAAQKRAAENIQDAFAQAFANIDEGIGGMVKGFLEAFKQILANAAALDLANALGIGDKLKAGGAGSGSVLGSIFKGIGKVFGFAGGGNVTGGKPIRVGEAGPELFVPYASGRIVPNAAGMAGGSVAFSPVTSITIQGNTDDRSKQELLSYIEAKDARNQRELMRMLERNGFGRLR